VSAEKTRLIKSASIKHQGRFAKQATRGTATADNRNQRAKRCGFNKQKGKSNREIEAQTQKNARPEKPTRLRMRLEQGSDDEHSERKKKKCRRERWRVALCCIVAYFRVVSLTLT